jgi:ribosomal protein L11 methylase PrmA
MGARTMSKAAVKPDLPTPLASSFQDPSGFVFRQNQTLYRQINAVYHPHYTQLMDSGLYQALVDAGQLVSHCDVSTQFDLPQAIVIEPQQIHHISYPYEWCFSQLKDAALLTLNIQKTALEHGMNLKDATAYNVQFESGRPIFIDTLSFEPYVEGKPWVAYQQFCKHFLAPLALMAYTDTRLNQLLLSNIDGIPLDLAAKLLPLKSWFNLHLLTHIGAQAKFQAKYARVPANAQAGLQKQRSVSKLGLLALLDSLTSAINSLDFKPQGTEWADYYAANNNYSGIAFEHKKELVLQALEATKGKTLWDLGANTGVFSRLGCQLGMYVCAYDIDPEAVEAHYRSQKASSQTEAILPLILNLRTPSPAIGWHNQERNSFNQRGPADVVMALALVHHLAIGCNLPLEKIAHQFADLGQWLIIEFVPKADEQVQKLLYAREDIFTAYDETGFEAAFDAYFQTVEKTVIADSCRTLYVMKRR